MTEEHTEKRQEQLEARLQQQLRATENDLDTRTAARLAAARREALAQEDEPRQGWSFGAPAFGTVAALAVVAIVVTQTWQPEGQTPMNTAPVATEMLTTQSDSTEQPNVEALEPEPPENLELLEFYEDLEFYEWLAENELEEMPS